MTLLSRIKETAKQRGLSIEEVADKASKSSKDVKISRSSLYQWDKHEPKPSAVKAVADVLGVSIDYLLGNTDEMHPSKINNTRKMLDLSDTDDDTADTIISIGRMAKEASPKDREKALKALKFLEMMFEDED